MIIYVVYKEDNPVNREELVGAHIGKTFVNITPPHPLEWLLLDDGMDVGTSGFMFQTFISNPTVEEGVKIFLLDHIGFDFINQFTRERAKERLTDILRQFREHEDPLPVMWGDREVSQEEIYWAWLAFGLSAESGVNVIDYYITEWENKEVPVLHYTRSLVFHGYANGFIEGMAERRKEQFGTLSLVEGV